MSVRAAIVDQVAAFVCAMGRTSIRQVKDDLRLTTDQAKDALRALEQRGRVHRPERGVYAWRALGNQQEGAVSSRVWHAMAINPSWTVEDVARQADTTANYVRRCMVLWKKEKLLEPFGQRSLPEGGRLKVYRLTARGRQLPNPGLHAPWAPDALTLDAVELARLVATGVAARFPREARRALALAEAIAQELRRRAHDLQPTAAPESGA